MNLQAWQRCAGSDTSRGHVAAALTCASSVLIETRQVLDSWEVGSRAVEERLLPRQIIEAVTMAFPASDTRVTVDDRSTSVTPLRYGSENELLRMVDEDRTRRFREVPDPLASRELLDDQVGAQVNLEEATRDAYRLSNMRFREGVDGYLSVLDSQRAQYASQQDLINARLARLRI